MTLSFKHTFTSSKSDGSDATLVQPSNWNQEHAVTAAVNKFLGTGASSTAVTEFACTAQGRSILAAADIAALTTAISAGFFTTGDVKITLKVAADVGWIFCNDGSIGDASSNATTRANADTAALFTLLYTNIPGLVVQNSAGVTSSRVDAASDYAAHKRLVVPKVLGRALAVAGQGAFLTNRVLGDPQGAETVTVGQGNLPSVNFTTSVSGSASVTAGGSSVLVVNPAFATTNAAANSGGSPLPVYTSPTYITPDTISISASGTAASGGSGTPLSIIPPETYMHVMIKL